MFPPCEGGENGNLNVSNDENIEVVEDEKHDENAENPTSSPEETLEENSTEE